MAGCYLIISVDARAQCPFLEGGHTWEKLFVDPGSGVRNLDCGINTDKKDQMIFQGGFSFFISYIYTSTTFCFLSAISTKNQACCVAAR